MPIRQPDGSPGLLATGKFGDAVTAELGKLCLEKEIGKIISDEDQVGACQPTNDTDYTPNRFHKQQNRWRYLHCSGTTGMWLLLLFIGDC